MKKVAQFKSTKDDELDSDDREDLEDNKLLQSDASMAFLDAIRAAKNH